MNSSRILFGAVGLLLSATGLARAESTDTAPLASPLSLSPAAIYASDAPTSAPVADAPFLDNKLHFSLAIPLWVPGLDGSIKVRGSEVNPDSGAGDTASDLNVRLNFALAAHTEIRKNRLAVFADLMYVDVGIKRTEEASTEVSLSGIIGELGLAYTLVAPEKTGFGAFRLDAIGGVRVSDIRVGLNSPSFAGSANATIYDPFVGLRGEFGLTNWLALQARGDVGGFGINEWPTSDISYNLQAGLDFKLASWCELAVGYRWLKYKFGDRPELLQFDATLGGPFVNLQFNF